MPGLIGLARAGAFREGERVRFMHTGGLPALQVHQREVLGGLPSPLAAHGTVPGHARSPVCADG